MKLTWAGVGGAFAGVDQWHTNAVIEAENGKKLLVDVGGDIRHSLAQIGLGILDIDAIYISHLHGDHCYGAEWAGFLSFFHPAYENRPKLYIVDALIGDLWDTLKGSMESLEGQVATLYTYFDVHPISINSSIIWQGVHLTPVQTVHVVSGYGIKHSYGLIVKGKKFNQQIFLTTDTQFSPRQIEKFYKESDHIFHDCETLPFRSNVHAHILDLDTLDPDIKSKMRLIHYAPGHDFDAGAMGFAGFVERGQYFEFKGDEMTIGKTPEAFHIVPAALFEKMQAALSFTEGMPLKTLCK